jgi:hypothetical protein
MAEAKVRVREMNGGDWRDSLSFDPVMIPVEESMADGEPYMTDVFDATVIGLVDAIIAADMFPMSHPLPADSPSLEFDVVWSGNGRSVKGNCPVCDDVFPIAEGAPGDELNEGYDAVFCGCDPADQHELD